ncbi:MAG: DUF427 domain-containing protein [Jiangellaceae bacterium]
MAGYESFTQGRSGAHGRNLRSARRARTTCAYKGHASFWSVRVGDGSRANLAWTYEQPRRDAEPVRDLVCFFNEQVDLELDGELGERPVSPWSEPDWWRGAAMAFENRL